MFTRKELRNDTDSLRPDRAGKKIEDLGTFTIVFYYNISKFFSGPVGPENGLGARMSAAIVGNLNGDLGNWVSINGNYRMYFGHSSHISPARIPFVCTETGNFEWGFWELFIKNMRIVHQNMGIIVYVWL